MSYCATACCLRHHRVMYWNLQNSQWVHQDGWPCEARP